MSLDPWIELSQVVNVAAYDLDILQTVLGAGGASEGKDCCPAFQPAHMHLHTRQSMDNMHKIHVLDVVYLIYVSDFMY